MGQYTAPHFSSAQTISSGDTTGSIVHELNHIAQAHNIHAGADIVTSGSVSRAALICDKGHFSMTLKSCATLTGPLTTSDISAYCVVPFACQVITAFAWVLTPGYSGTTISGTGFYVYKEDDPDKLIFSSSSSACLSNEWTIQPLGPFLTDLAAGDVLTMRNTVATGEVSGYVTFSILAKAVHD